MSRSFPGLSWIPLLAALLALSAGCAHEPYKAALRANTPEAYRSFLIAHPRHPKASEAAKRVEYLELQRARRAGTEAAYRHFLHRYPDSRWTPVARAEAERAAFKETMARDTVKAWQRFLRRYPRGTKNATARLRLQQKLEKMVAQARGRGDLKALRRLARVGAGDQTAREALEVLEFRKAAAKGTAGAYKRFLTLYPKGSLTAMASGRLHRLAFMEAREAHSAGRLAAYLAAYPRSPQAKRARALLSLHRNPKGGLAQARKALARRRPFEAARVLNDLKLHVRPAGAKGSVDLAYRRLVKRLFAERRSYDRMVPPVEDRQRGGSPGSLATVFLFNDTPYDALFGLEGLPDQYRIVIVAAGKRQVLSLRAGPYLISGRVEARARFRPMRGKHRYRSGRTYHIRLNLAGGAGSPVYRCPRGTSPVGGGKCCPRGTLYDAAAKKCRKM